METSLFEIAASQGLWAALFIFLFVCQLREGKQAREESRVREDKLNDFISNMSKNFEKLATGYSQLAKDVDYIKVEIIKGVIKKNESAD